MGNLTTNPASTSTSSNKETNNTEGNHTSVELETEGAARRHRFSDSNIILKKDSQIRADYLRRINLGLKKENIDRLSGKGRTENGFSDFEHISSTFIGSENGNSNLLPNLVNDSILDDRSSKDHSKIDKYRERGKLTSFYKKRKQKEDESEKSRCLSTEPFKNSFTLANDTVLVDFEDSEVKVLDEDNINIATNNPNLELTAKRSFGVRKKNYSDLVGKRITDKEDDEEVQSQLSKSTVTKGQSEYEIVYLKKAENLRRSYIAKLIYKNVWTPLKIEKDHNTLIIFDWDDTLLCTSFLTPNGVFNEEIQLSDKEYEKIIKLEFAVLRILTLAIEKGDTYIITNAAPGWVEYSVERFYPSVKKLLDKVTIVSARGEYESLYPGDSRMWKIQAFLKMQKQHDPNLVTNLICLGDSFIEMEAAHILASKFQQAFIKTIKFRESPKPEELNKQLLLVADQFATIFSVVKNLTIRVEKKIK
jgi:hypothetical protein